MQKSSSVPDIPKERRGIRLIRAIRKGPLGYFTRLVREEGGHAWINLAGQSILVVTDATAIEYVLQTHAANYRKGKHYKVLEPLLGKGILLSEGADWQKQRREMAPAFAHQHMEGMVRQMTAATEAMFKRWEPLIAAGQPVDLTAEMMWYTLDILLRALFHEAKDGIAPQVNHALGLVLKEAESRIWSIFSWPQRLILKLPKYRAAFAFLNDLATELVAGHKTRTDYPDDLLAKLIARYGSTTSGTGLLRDQIMTLLFAGHETSAVGLAWSLTMLAAHPVIYERMTSEIDRVLKGKSPTLEILKALPYTSQVFDEVLRLYPPVWTISRTALADDLIPTDDGVGVEIPQGTVTMLCIHALHRREAYWPNPEVFDPERFTSEAIASRHKFAWLPFGGGPRQCIGFRFATIESMIALTMINQKYRLSLVPGQTPQPYPSITLRPDGPLMFWIERRQPESISDTNATEAPLTPARCPFHTLAA